MLQDNSSGNGFYLAWKPLFEAFTRLKGLTFG
ncbi:hypothetical protein PMI34_01196 [Pseudomonas sp. GM74]|jgi:hypothetical protein|nr:hypothetical protein PMI28_05709 [Pseudomonas sp. GM48]EJM94452.1 hypothetical protein PMI34_01196 [Pseudomonas sp. GM74]MDF9778060.1 hypothetical protein [Pseudomonas baetica]